MNAADWSSQIPWTADNLAKTNHIIEVRRLVRIEMFVFFRSKVSRTTTTIRTKKIIISTTAKTLQARDPSSCLSRVKKNCLTQKKFGILTICKWAQINDTYRESLDPT